MLGSHLTPNSNSPISRLYLPYISQVLGSHLTPNSNSETQQLVDGDLTCAVLQLLPLLDSPEYVTERSAESSNPNPNPLNPNPNPNPPTLTPTLLIPSY